MGIKNLNKLIKDCQTTFSYKTFSGYRLGIDAENLMRICMGIIYPKLVNSAKLPEEFIVTNKWLEKSTMYIYQWIKNDITPVFVFDGCVPQDKLETQKNRSEKYKTKQRKIETMTKILSDNYIEENKKIETSNELVKILKQNIYISFKQREMFKKLLDTIGIPYIIPKCEAEKLCSILSIEGIFYGVFSRDTDLVPLGCRYIITSDNIYEKKMMGYKLVDIMKKLKFSLFQLVDMCILAGCDYNIPIPKIGIINSYNIIKQYISLDNIPNKYDKSTLNIEKCRELFYYNHSSNYISENTNFDVFINNDIISDEFLFLTKLINTMRLKIKKEMILKPKTAPDMNLYTLI